MGQYDEAYAVFSPVYKQMLPLQKFIQLAKQFNDKAGYVKERKIVRITWSENPEGAPLPGKYAAVDFNGQFNKINKYCGYIILHENAHGELQVMREEENFMDVDMEAKIAKEYSQQKAEEAWQQLSQYCPK